MAEHAPITINASPSEGAVRITHIIYGLHAFSLITGIIGAATIVGMFLTGWPSIIAVIINYVKQGDVKGTYLESHFRWQIRTFWYAALWCVISVILFVTLIGIPFAFVIMVALSAWLIYRIARGWLNLNAGKPMYQ
jgi:uncharacterized membrane protein